MTENDERDLAPDAYLDDIDDWDDDEERWQPLAKGRGRRDRRSAIRKPKGSFGL